MHIILNALSLACAESSIGSLQVGCLMALSGVPMWELFVYVGYWWRARVLRARQRAESIKTKVIPDKHQRYFNFEGMSLR